MHTLCPWQLAHHRPLAGTSCPKPHKPPTPTTHVQARPWGEAKAASTHRDPKAGQPAALWVGAGWPEGSPHCSLRPFTVGYSSTPPDFPLPHGLRTVSLWTRRCPLPTSQSSVRHTPSKGPIYLSCSQLRGCLLSPRGLVPQFIPAPYLKLWPPSPSASLPTPILTPSPGCPSSQPP